MTYALYEQLGLSLIFPVLDNNGMNLLPYGMVWIYFPALDFEVLDPYYNH